MSSISRYRFLVGSVFLALSASPLVNAGPLDPPGPPAPTFKTLGEIEARQGIKANTELIEPIVIDQPGSYYLLESITSIPNENAITITASDVTLDLNGFTVSGNNEVADKHGIEITGTNVTILNGTVKNADLEGIYCNGGDFARLIDVSAISNGNNGVSCSKSHILRGNFNNNTGVGLAGNAIYVEGVRASNNTLNGMNLGSGSFMTRSLTHNNGNSGVSCMGGSVVTQSTGINNTNFNNFGCTIYESYFP